MIKVKVAGGVGKYQLLMLNMFKHRDLFNNFQITYYDMPNNCAWNGGRINRTITLTDTMLNTFNNYKRGFCLGFTNMVILDVGDPVGNALLDMVSNNNPHKLHGVVLMSETLRRYIRRNYPDLILTYSITGHPTTDQLNFEGYYRELEEKYDIIVPKFSHIDHIVPLIEAGKLNPEKYEILINDNCSAACQVYSEHFAQISHMNTVIHAPWDDEWAVSHQVEVRPKSKKTITRISHCHQDDIEGDDLQRLYDCGIRHFKIGGRDLYDQAYEESTVKNLLELKKLNKGTTDAT